MTTLFDKLERTVRTIRERIETRKPTVGLILGSGLGGFAEQLQDAVAIDYSELPGFSVSTVSGHAGRMLVGTINGTTCAALQGRTHMYEGHSAADVAFPARALVHLGCKTLIITNAAGGLRSSFEPGTLMLIDDHINLQGDNPLRGSNDDRLGTRFPDMTHVYDPELRGTAKRVASAASIDLASGVYASMPGPSYETPAEIRMLSAIGADAVGMSTVPEAIAARHMSARVLGISCITNKAAGISEQELSHDEVKEAAAVARDAFQSLLQNVITELGSAS